jgi:hypothetical protein
MTPDDLAALLRWLYANDDGGGWLPAAARDLRLNERNLRGMLTGKLATPPTVRCVVIVLVAAHSMLRGWADKTNELQALPLSAAVRAMIEHHARLI